MIRDPKNILINGEDSSENEKVVKTDQNGVLQTFLPNHGYNQIVDVNGDGYTYVGIALPGTATSAAGWMIRRIGTTGTQTITLLADADDNFDNIWDDRTSLSYP